MVNLLRKTAIFEYHGKEIEVDYFPVWNTIAISVDGVWAGNGEWSGHRVENCCANLGDDLWDMIDCEIKKMVEQ